MLGDGCHQMLAKAISIGSDRGPPMKRWQRALVGSGTALSTAYWFLLSMTVGNDTQAPRLYLYSAMSKSVVDSAILGDDWQESMAAQHDTLENQTSLGQANVSAAAAAQKQKS